MVAVNNSWIIHKSFQDDKESILQYLMPLSENLIELGQARNKNKRGSGAGRPSKKMKIMKDIGKS